MTSDRPRNLTDAVKARQARRNGGAGGHDSSERGTGRENSGGGAATAKDTGRQSQTGSQSWLSRLLSPLRQLGQKLLDILEGLASDPADGARKLGALAVASLLAKRLPGPLGWLAGLISSYLKGERGFGFWWKVVTLGVALAVGALVALLVSPVAALIALLVAGIVMLVRRTRKDDGDEDRSQAHRDDDTGHERGPASEPAPAAASA